MLAPLKIPELPVATADNDGKLVAMMTLITSVTVDGCVVAVQLEVPSVAEAAVEVAARPRPCKINGPRPADFESTVNVCDIIDVRSRDVVPVPLV